MLERCMYWRGVRITDVSVLERCQYWKDVCIREILKSIRIRDVCLLE